MRHNQLGLLKTLSYLNQTVSIPVVAIGGINKSNLLELTDTGVDGVALVSAIFAVKDIESECKELLSLSKQII